MKNKKSLTILSLSGLLALGAIGGSLAYLTDTDTAVNEFAAGKVNVDIEGEDWKQTLVPGKTYDLTRNIILREGSENAFVRVIVRVKKGAILSDMMKEAAGVPANSSTWALYDEGFHYESGLWNMDQGTYGNMIRSKRDGDDMIYVFYYQSYNPTDSLRPGQERSMFKPTQAATDGDINLGTLFTSFTVPASWDNEETARLEGLSIEQEVQAIQSWGTSVVSSRPEWNNVSKAWEFWYGQNGIPADLDKNNQ